MAGRAIVWTDDMDFEIRTRRGELGESWASIGAILGVGKSAAQERGRALHVKYGTVAKVHQESLLHAPREAGHPATWDLINAGTSLQGEPLRSNLSVFSHALECQWIDGDPAGAETVFCCSPVVSFVRGEQIRRSAYCGLHHISAYPSATLAPTPVAEQERLAA